MALGGSLVISMPKNKTKNRKIHDNETHILCMQSEQYFQPLFSCVDINVQHGNMVWFEIICGFLPHTRYVIIIIIVINEIKKRRENT